MVLCNVSSVGNSSIIFIDTTECNLTSLMNADDADVKTTYTYDGDGALKYCLAVVLVYGLAVIGVLMMGFCTRRKQDNLDTDKETTICIKDIDKNGQMFEKKRRKDVIKDSLEIVHISSRSSVLSAGFLPSLSVATMPLQSIEEEESKSGGLQLADDTCRRQQNDGPNSKVTFVTIIDEEDSRVFIQTPQRNRVNPEKVQNVSFSSDVYEKNIQLSDTESTFLLDGNENYCQTESVCQFNMEGKACSKTESAGLSLPEIDFAVDDDVFLDEGAEGSFYDAASRQHSPDWVAINRKLNTTVTL